MRIPIFRIPIVPADMLHYLTQYDQPEYLMALAQYIDPSVDLYRDDGSDESAIQVYTEFHKLQSNKGSKVILDNGCCEGQLVTTAQLIERAVYINAYEMALPDVLQDAEATLRKTYEALNIIQKIPEAKHIRLMGIPQGKDLKEWIQCAHTMLTMGIDTVGIPKILASNNVQNRLFALNRLELPKNISRIDAHLLGCWSDPLEVANIEANMRRPDIFVRSCDSCIPYIYSKYNNLIGEHPRPLGKMDFLYRHKNFDRPEIIATFEENMTRWRVGY